MFLISTPVSHHKGTHFFHGRKGCAAPPTRTPHPRGGFYKSMFAKCPAGRPGTADEVAGVAELLMDSRGAFITVADFLVDGGATASYFYGPLRP